jgi:hypothetical protein
MNYTDYNPGRFGSLANTAFGRKLWAFVTDDETLKAMEVASDLGQPAVAGIEEALLRQFKDEVLGNRIKQLIGHMVRQAMEFRGFVVDQNDVMSSVPFSKVTRYRRPGWYMLHVFRSSADSRDLCFRMRGPEINSLIVPGAANGAIGVHSRPSFGTVGFGIKPQEVREEIKKRDYARRRLELIVRADL